jgi:hypothetical protein
MLICEEERSNPWLEVGSENAPSGSSHGWEEDEHLFEDLDVQRPVVSEDWAVAIIAVLEDAAENSKQFVVHVFQIAPRILEGLRDCRLKQVPSERPMRGVTHVLREASSKWCSSQEFNLHNDTLQFKVFLDQVYQLSNLGKVHAAGDIIFDLIQGFLKAGSFSACDQLLSMVDVPRLNPALMITFLATTFTARDRLRAREAYFSRVLAYLTEERGEDRAKRLLDKYH